MKNFRNKKKEYLTMKFGRTIFLLTFCLVALLFGVKTVVIGQVSIKTDLDNLRSFSPDLVVAYDKIKIFEAWDFVNQIRPFLNRVSIGVIDTGIDASDGRHPEFLGIDFGNSPAPALKDIPPKKFLLEYFYQSGHGTAVAGIIGANNLSITEFGNPQMNGLVSGIKDLSYIIESRKTDLISIMKFSEFIDGLGVDTKIINMSFGSTQCSKAPLIEKIYRQCVKDEDFTKTIRYYSEGFRAHPDKLFVASAGNDGNDVFYTAPANLGLRDNLISVGATDLNDQRAKWPLGGSSNYGRAVGIAAPGKRVYAPAIRGKGDYPSDTKNYDTNFSGTSASAPMVTGVAAILKALEPEYQKYKPSIQMKPEIIKDILIKSADAINTGEPDKRLGRGCYNEKPTDTGCRLNAHRAVAWLFPPVSSILSYSDLTSNSVKLSWTENEDPDFLFYRLYRTIVVDGIPQTTLVTTIYDQSQLNYTDTGLSPNTRYYYRLITFDQAGLWSRSNLATVTTPFLVPFANILIDGNPSDWQSLTPSIIDPPGDKIGTFPGTDITNVYLAKDNTYFYVRVDLADGSPNTDEEDRIYYALSLNKQPETQVGDLYLRSQFFPSPEAFKAILRERTSIEPHQAITIAKDIAAPGSDFLEMRIPLVYLPKIFYLYSRASTSEPGLNWDWTSQITIQIF